METKTRFKRRGIKRRGRGIHDHEKGVLFEMQKHVNCRGKTSVNGGAFDGTKRHKKKHTKACL